MSPCIHPAGSRTIIRPRTNSVRAFSTGLASSSSAVITTGNGIISVVLDFARVSVIREGYGAPSCVRQRAALERSSGCVAAPKILSVVTTNGGSAGPGVHVMPSRKVSGNSEAEVQRSIVRVSRSTSQSSPTPCSRYVGRLRWRSRRRVDGLSTSTTNRGGGISRQGRLADSGEAYTARSGSSHVVSPMCTPPGASTV